MRQFFCCLFTAILLSAPAWSQQQQFSYSRDGNSHLFRYQWHDFSNNAENVRFALPVERLQQLPTIQPNYRKAIAQRYVWVKMMEAAQRIDPRTARIKITPRGEDILLNIRARNASLQQDVQTQLRQAQEDAFTAYLHEHYFARFTTPYRQQAVKPDHLRYIQESIEPLIPLAQAFYEKVDAQSDARQYLNLLLSWVQSIPYDELENRAQSNGAGFSPPLTLLTQNKGDCDSKAVLTAAATRAFLPDTPMLLVLLREHAVLGIALTPLSGETLITQGNTRYVVFDPTGPALMPFGQVSSATKRELASGLYTTEVIN
ncbi:hypothetical protein [Alteromonas halophila]|uniref:Transglutaminase domain-containing protein n=1 Tax=Alteromonas halophila TaxID=516698 RepID=A0A918JIB3_9ALTE|nr:hypothetical protein [Alteromonas halophila]GGW80106.1 hypothetical protein GCM10007391_11190 [Alteromonas halophila]